MEAPRSHRGRRRGQHPGNEDEAGDGGRDVERGEPGDDRVQVSPIPTVGRLAIDGNVSYGFSFVGMFPFQQ